MGMRVLSGHKAPKNTPLFLVIIGLLFSVVGAGVFGAILMDYHVFKQNAIPVQAIITDIVRNSNSSNSSHTAHVTFYTDCGNEITTALSNWSSSMRVGQPINIHYSPDNPRNVRAEGVETFMGIFMAVFGAIGTALVICGAVIFRKNSGKAQLKQQLTEEGHSVMADIAEIRRRNYTVNGVSPFLIRCTYADGYQEHEFVKKAYYGNSVYDLNIGDKLRVWVDRNDYGRYWIELE
jgi:hypothetical protein